MRERVWAAATPVVKSGLLDKAGAPVSTIAQTNGRFPCAGHVLLCPQRAQGVRLPALSQAFFKFYPPLCPIVVPISVLGYGRGGPNDDKSRHLASGTSSKGSEGFRRAIFSCFVNS